MQTFYLVAKEGSYSRAARQLNISYQSAANHVRRLEQAIGYKLVHSEQGMKSNVLTARGKSLYQLLMPEFDIMLARLGSVMENERPLVRVGMPQAIFYYFFPAIIRNFSLVHENSEILCYERDLALVDMVTAGHLDAFITERSVTGREIRQLLIGSYHLALIYPKAWPAPTEDSLPSWANDRPFITYEPGHIIRNMALRYMTDGDKKPSMHVSTSGSSSVKKCVTAGLGFAIIPTWTIGELPEDTGMLLLGSWPKIPVYFGEATYLEHNPYVKTLRELCLTHLADAFEP
jgi:molybdate transport repressor ModE-like protein